MALVEYKCPNCGGSISFDAAAQEMKCPYCDSIIEVAALRQFDNDLATNQTSEAIDWNVEGEPWKEGELDPLVTYVCTNCGGEIAVDRTVGATKCPFCDSPVVVGSQFAGTLRPNLVVPFKITKEEAVAALQKHYLGKRLLPKVFKDQNHIDEIRGIYVPFWLFDAQAEATITYRATNVRTWRDRRFIYTETSHYGILRRGGIEFDGIPEDGSSKMPDNLMESIEPFDLTQAVDFQTAYLSGFLANKYDVEAQAMLPRANNRVVNSMAEAFRGTVSGYATVAEQSRSVNLANGRIRYGLLPVWMLNTSWNGNLYTFAMNGQTGKFVGDLPMDKGAYWKWTLGVGLPSALVLGLLAVLL
ncbi:MAG: hypothetical protein LBR21_02450 [Propionibacteriaceae bacterium]|jgi:DNA-directed RNA polymerase subunit RPC12/RpoP|nr:hypothetical protein [Propionibacteriaceae bacterium]